MSESKDSVRCRRNLAVFDLDHTITRHDTYLRFLAAVLRRRPWRLIHCSILPLAVLWHKSGFKNNAWLKEVFLSMIAGGASRSLINDIATSFVMQTLKKDVYSTARQRIQFHRERNDYLILASASFDIYVPLLGESLGFDKILCTEAAWHSNDRLSGKINGNNCYGPHKEQAVNALLQNWPDRGDVFFYSDHHSDLPVFLLADQAISVNPTPTLRELAHKHCFVIEHWQ